MTAGLTLICSSCGFSVADYDGYLYVSVTAAMDLYTADRAQRPGAASAAEIIGEDVVAFVTRPRIAVWQVTHNRCDIRPHFEDDYHIGPERMRTLQDVGYWSEHLSAKRWFRFTDWDALMREVAGISLTDRIQVTRRAAA